MARYKNILKSKVLSEGEEIRRQHFVECTVAELLECINNEDRGDETVFVGDSDYQIIIRKKI